MGGTKLSLAVRRQTALDLALQGRTAREIAATLGISKSQAHRDVRTALRGQAKATEKEALAHREYIGERYETLMAAWWQTALTDPESAAGDKILKALEGLRRLFGLDRPVEQKEDGDAGPRTLIVNRVYLPATRNDTDTGSESDTA